MYNKYDSQEAFFMQRDICLDRLRARALHQSHEPAYYTYNNNQWISISWRDYHKKIRSFAKALMANNLKVADKIAILGFNRLEWLVACVGTQYAAGISVGIYTSSSPEEVSYVVDHCDAEILIVENLERYNKQINLYKNKISKIKKIILMSNEICNEENMVNFETFLNEGQNISDQELNERQKSISSDDVATMIYTSGTTGNPKSVMLTHESITWTVRTVVQGWGCNSQDRALSYLPLAHVAEQLISIYAPIESGMQSYFVASTKDFARNLKEVEPTVLFGVPRVYEKIYEGIKANLAEQKLITQKIFGYFSSVSKSYYENHHRGERSNVLICAQQAFGRKKIFDAIKKKIGLGKVRICACGAAPISADILRFFSGIDLPIYEVFGQSENCGPTTLNLPGFARIGSVGRAMPGSEIRIADDGEILIRGPHVFAGYYKDPAATSETLKDGWLYTGDIGSFDEHNFLRITDRKKDLLITAGGKNISPQNLESMLKHLPYVQSAVVVGDSKKYLCALLSPDKEALSKKATLLGLDPQQALNLVTNKNILEEIKEELGRINSKLAPVEQIKKIALLNHEFSIESGEFTPTLKVKRKFVNQKYQTEINNLYLESSVSF